MGEPIEERMMAEYLAATYAPGTYVAHVRLGQPRGTPPGTTASAEERALKLMTLPEADAIVRFPDHVEVLEFIVWRPQETIGQLLYYLGLVPSTPGYADVTPDRVRGMIVSGLEDQRVSDLAARLGLGFEVYRPPWLLEALAARRGRS